MRRSPNGCTRDFSVIFLIQATYFPAEEFLCDLGDGARRFKACPLKLPQRKVNSRRFIMKCSVKVLFSFVPVVALLMLDLNTAAAQSWYNSSWAYRRAVTISNPGGTTLTDLQVQITLDGSFNFAGAKSDGSDIRLTSGDGMTLIPFWIENWISPTTASIWVKVPSVPTSGTTLYLYYGNATATSASNGTSTFKFFDDFTNPDTLSQKNWIRILNYPWGTSGYVPHDWKYSMEMQQGALYFALLRSQNGWNIASLDTMIQQEFDFIHSQINPDGSTVGTHNEPQYEYGVTLSNLALAYLYFKTANPALSAVCYSDMVKVYGYVKSQWQNVIGLGDAGGSSMALHGFSNAWKAFNDFGNTTSANEVRAIVQNYATTFINNQSGGNWSGASGIQEHEKRDFGVLTAYDVTGDASYLTAVKNNIDYLLSTFWLSSNGGLTWYGSTSDPFYECHQQWFMIAVKMLYNRSGGAYDYLTQGQMAWHFLTDNNYANIDTYVHNYVNHGAFFSYRNLSSGGSYNLDGWKGSYEIGAALWGMALNYDWVSSYQSSHSTQAYNYLDQMVKQVKNFPTNKGFYFQGSVAPRSSLWSKVGSPTVAIVQDNGKNVLSLVGSNDHFSLLTTTDRSFNNFIFETKVKMLLDVNNSCTPEMHFRETDVNNMYFAMLRGEAINDIYVRRYQGGSQYINASYPFNYNANQYYNFKISVNADSIKLYLDGVRQATYRDIGTGVLSGGLSILNYGAASPIYHDNVRVRMWVDPEPTSSVGAEEQADGLPETQSCTITGMVYSFPLSNVTMAFSVLPPSGGNVTVRRYLETPPYPTYPNPPTGSTYIPLWYDITSPLANNSFSGTITVDVSGVSGFGVDSKVMYYNATTGRWVLLSGTYNAGAQTFTFSTTHFTPFAFINTPATAYDVFISTSPSVASAGAVYPNATWGGGYLGQLNDWGYTGTQPFSLYIVPQSGTTLGACELVVEYDSAVVALDTVLFMGSIFTGPNLLYAGSNRFGSGDRVTLNASLIDPTNVTVGVGDYIAELKMKLKKPGHGTVALIGDHVLSFNPGSSPSSVYITPHQAEVKAYLGDVASSGGEATGDGKINFQDLAPWSASYWSGVPPVGMTNYKSKYDIGPTQDGYVFSLPTHDLKIDFEDLVMFSIGYGQTVRSELPKILPQSEPLVVSLGKPVGVGDELRVPVLIGGGVTDVRAMKLELNGQFGSLLGVDKGELTRSYETPVMLMSRAEGHRVYVDLAVMGLEAQGLNRGGEVAVVRFAGATSVGLVNAECRSSRNTGLATNLSRSTVGTMPTKYGLGQNYPNPFNPTTTIEYQIPVAGKVTLEVYSILGVRVATLLNDAQEAGFYQVMWDGSDDNHKTVATGVYLYRVKAGDFNSVKKMVLLK